MGYVRPALSSRRLQLHGAGAMILRHESSGRSSAESGAHLQRTRAADDNKMGARPGCKRVLVLNLAVEMWNSQSESLTRALRHKIA